MTFFFVVLAMIGVGLLVGYLAGFIWKDNRPIGVQGDYIAAVIAAVVMGLVDWLVIPALGFSDSIRNLGLLLEPAGTALLVLWVIRKAKS
jgi:uncharacterized membrane protein YeaQ/YmgE (transglycosylase-associated protein family)